MPNADLHPVYLIPIMCRRVLRGCSIRSCVSQNRMFRLVHKARSSPPLDNLVSINLICSYCTSVGFFDNLRTSDGTTTLMILLVGLLSVVVIAIRYATQDVPGDIRLLSSHIGRTLFTLERTVGMLILGGGPHYSHATSSAQQDDGIDVNHTRALPEIPCSPFSLFSLVPSWQVIHTIEQPAAPLPGRYVRFANPC